MRFYLSKPWIKCSVGEPAEGSLTQKKKKESLFFPFSNLFLSIQLKPGFKRETISTVM